MIGIQSISSFVPEIKESNLDRLKDFNIDDRFLLEKIGVSQRSVLSSTMELSKHAFEKLIQIGKLDLSKVELLIVVTQNPDLNIPHTSALIHGHFDLPTSCMCFDISLGCSGYAYAISSAKTLMESLGLKIGVVITADPYSKIIDKFDKNTCLLFGDASTATLLSENYEYLPVAFDFGTSGKDWSALVCERNVLHMDGRKVFNFVMKNIPVSISRILKKSGVALHDIDRFIFHQGSKYILQSLIHSLRLDDQKVPVDLMNYGNTVSSSIPIILEKYIERKDIKNILISGFGVGMSYGTAILRRKHD